MSKPQGQAGGSSAPKKSLTKSTGSLLATPYPSVEQWLDLLRTFDSKAIAHKLLLAHVPYVFRDEPLKFALFRRTIADAFGVQPTNVFIVGSAMAGRSLKGDAIEQEYSAKSDIDTLIISEPLFTHYLMRSLEWLQETTKGTKSDDGTWAQAKLSDDDVRHISFLSKNASNGIWRPDALPKGAEAREEFFEMFSDVSLKTLGLQLSDDTVAKVNGRIARSFQDAMDNLANSLRRLRWEMETAQDDEESGGK